MQILNDKMITLSSRTFLFMIHLILMDFETWKKLNFLPSRIMQTFYSTDIAVFSSLSTLSCLFSLEFQICLELKSVKWVSETQTFFKQLKKLLHLEVALSFTTRTTMEIMFVCSHQCHAKNFVVFLRNDEKIWQHRKFVFNEMSSIVCG